MQNNAYNLINIEATMNDQRTNSAAILGPINKHFQKI